MARYQRLQPDTKAPWDAVVLTVWLSGGRTVADIAAPEFIAEHPKPVQVMLQMAEELRNRAGLSRTMVRIEDAALWKPEWGQLVEYI